VRENGATVSRRDLLSLIEAGCNGAALYHAMTSLGFACNGCKGPIKLKGDPKGTSVLILGAGLDRYGGRTGVG
jgi:monoamine oxidase